MALAIGVWLYDTSPQLSQHGTDLNTAMLAAFGVSSNSAENSIINTMPETMVDAKGNKTLLPNGSSPYNNFDWLIK